MWVDTCKYAVIVWSSEKEFLDENSGKVFHWYGTLATALYDAGLVVKTGAYWKAVVMKMV